MSTRAAHGWAKPRRTSRFGTVGHGLRLLVALLLPLAGVSGLADTAAFAATNSTTGAVTAGPPAGAVAATVSGGLLHTCGVETDVTLACWGLNDNGQASPSGGSFSAVSAGDVRTCGVKTDGTLTCWGDNRSGQASPPSGTFTAVSAGNAHTCGVRTDGTLACWGFNLDGRASPPSGTFTAVSAGGAHTCGVRTDGTLACWRDNGFGGASPPSGTFTAVSAGNARTCGVRTDGTLACWGYNGFGEASPPSGSFTAVSAGGLHTCGARTDGTLACWGSNSNEQASPPSGTFTAVSAGDVHTCGVKTDGTLACWGDNEFGRASPPGGTFTTPGAGAALAALDPRALVVPASALGPDWSLSGQPTTTTIAGSQGPLQTYIVMYNNDVSSSSPRLASFAVAVTPNAAAADGFVDAVAALVQAQGGSALTPWQGLGDGRAYKIRGDLLVAESAPVGVGLDYVFRVGSVGVIVAAGGPATQEQAVDALARQFAGLQEDRVRAALQSAPATRAPAVAPPAPPAPPTSPGTVTSAVPPAPNPAVPDQSASSYCPPGQAPRLVAGFAALRDQVGDAMGQPVECEHPNAANGDALQQTTTGLAFYRRSTNTPTFTDGATHWALAADGLVSWTADSVDPLAPSEPGG